MTIREAAFALAGVAFAGLESSAAVQEVQAVGVGSRFDRTEVTKSVKFFWSEVDAGRLVIWIQHPRTGERQRVDPALLDGVPFLRSARFAGLTYLRPSHRLFGHLSEIFRLAGPATLSSWLGSVQLLVSTSELDRAAKRLRADRKREISRPPSERARGRPSKRAEVAPAIITVINEGRWTGVQSVKALAHLLSRPPINLAVGDATVRRTLDRLFADTGDRRYQRLAKARKSTK